MKEKAWIGDWPSPYRDAHGDAVRQFVGANPQKVAFHAWLQWLADNQLAAAQQRALAAGMPIGLYRDLAVGVDSGGAELWARPDWFVPRRRDRRAPRSAGTTGTELGLATVQSAYARGAGAQGVPGPGGEQHASCRRDPHRSCLPAPTALCRAGGQAGDGRRLPELPIRGDARGSARREPSRPRLGDRRGSRHRAGGLFRCDDALEHPVLPHPHLRTRARWRLQAAVGVPRQGAGRHRDPRSPDLRRMVERVGHEPSRDVSCLHVRTGRDGTSRAAR